MRRARALVNESIASAASRNGRGAKAAARSARANCAAATAGLSCVPHGGGLRRRGARTIFLGTTVEALDADRAVLRRAGEDIELRALDLVVPTRPMVPVCALGETLKVLEAGPAVFDVGDCREPRTAFEAMQEAAALGHRL